MASQQPPVEYPHPTTTTTPPISPRSMTSSSSSSSSASSSDRALFLLPGELQVHILSFLRAFDLSHVQHTCRFYNDPLLIHKVVTHQADHVYTRKYVVDMTCTSINTKTTTATKSTSKTLKGSVNTSRRARTTTSNDDINATDDPLYTLEHLRHMELTVVARILSTPEPKTGFYVSKSWIKKTLLWLEKVNEEHDAAPVATSTTNNNSKKKLSKKQQRQRNRRLSDVSPPWPNVNSDILCNHANLQRCGTKSARSRRRLLDKQAWKILKKLYPDSTQLDSIQGECLQCLVETETTKRTEHALAEQRKLERKQPLTNPLVRRFYTRTRGVPTYCLVGAVPTTVAGAETAIVEHTKNSTTTVQEEAEDKDEDQKPKARAVVVKEESSMNKTSSPSSMPCPPLVPGTYHLIPRAWCHQWRKYIKTGEGSLPLPPDASALLCHAHRLPLLPPHLEAYLYGETCQLLTTTRWESGSSVSAVAATATTMSAAGTATPRTHVVGIRPPLDPTTVQALLSAGLSSTELAAQQMAMMQLEQQPPPPPPQQHVAGAASPHSHPVQSSQSLNEVLDIENHIVVEIVTDDEWKALQETGCWPRQQQHFSVSFTISEATPKGDGKKDPYVSGQPQQRRRPFVSYSTMPCRDCDASGKASSSSMCLKNRARGLVHKRNQQQPKKTPQKGDNQKALSPTLEY